MSNIAFRDGDYIQQKDILKHNKNGLLFLNPQNRDILVGEQNGYNNFNSLIVNDNEQISDNEDVDYTNSSEYIVNHKIIINNNSNDYYHVDKAEEIIGTTDSSMTDGYITQQLNTLISEKPMVYDTSSDDFYYEIIKTNKYENQDIYEYISKKYTFKYPSNIGDKQFNYLLIFAYNSPSSSSNFKDTFLYLYKVNNTQDVELYYRYHNDGTSITITEDSPRIPTVYKAYWI